MLIGGNEEAKGKAFFRSRGLDLSRGHDRLLWRFDDAGSEFHTLAEWVLRLRDRSTGGNPVLFKINMSTGRGGPQGASRGSTKSPLCRPSRLGP